MTQQFDETKHDRLVSGEFTEKVQTKPEASIPAPVENSVTRATARGGVIIGNGNYDRDTPECDMQDALTDLMHYFDSIPADQMEDGASFADILESAQRMYASEKANPED